MASKGHSSFSLFQTSYSASCSSFSIKNILNLPEDTSEENETIPSKSAQAASHSSRTLPLVPRVVRASEHHTFANLSHCLPGFGFSFGEVSILHPVAPMNRFPFQSHGVSLGMEVIQRRRRRPLRKKKLRPLFAIHQIQTMENEFVKSRYVTEYRRAELASDLHLTETQVKTWFQNRRTKWKKEIREKGELPSPKKQRKCDEAIKQSLPEANLNFCNFQYQMHPTVWNAEHSFSFPSFYSTMVDYKPF